ncbi:hypothetical protein PLESTB_000130700 [Pleodorina starrii]|uniref:SET domain-containing protein n=1 Tax=Pleodorina starrii TaxID=330485 RepID=A0A9W6BBI1_9CHLO|nr:hypothetical protein PLESTM_000489900 [Pleodorina starrii]GLC48730.1 hypothetical protein PLESTB_000130700 [Pleodorina starrii]GLC74282.1 hypothetical protein PLESTF_001484700 [Pleodorina starrii]
MAAPLRSAPAGGDTHPRPRPRPGASSAGSSRFTGHAAAPVAARRRSHGAAAATAAPAQLQGWWRGRWGPALPAAAALGALEGGGAAAPSTAESTDTQLAQLPGQRLPDFNRVEQQQQGQQQGQQQPPVLQAGPSSPVYCEPDTLSGLLGQFINRVDGSDSGLQLDGLLAYYRRLGCSPQQLQEAVQALAPQPPLKGRATAAPPLSTAASAAGGTADVAGVLGAGGGGVGVGVSGRASLGVPEPELWTPAGPGLGPGGLTQQLQLAAWELLAAAVAAAAMAAYQSRPYGWSRRDLLEVRQSNIAGRGVFARAPIPAGTVLGSYPGRLRSAAEMVAKCEVAPLAASYAFRTGDGRFLDPTDVSGQPSPYPQPGWPWPLPTDVVLSYVNEPPKGSPGTNASVEDGPQAGELLFLAATDIPPGAEVLIDYGVTYDRSGYGRRPGG